MDHFSAVVSIRRWLNRRYCSGWLRCYPRFFDEDPVAAVERQCKSFEDREDDRQCRDFSSRMYSNRTNVSEDRVAMKAPPMKTSWHSDYGPYLLDETEEWSELMQS